MINPKLSILSVDSKSIWASLFHSSCKTLYHGALYLVFGLFTLTFTNWIDDFVYSVFVPLLSTGATARCGLCSMQT